MLVPEVVQLPDEASVWARWGQVEHDALEFKRQAEKKLQEPIAAMAMAAGGLVAVGVTNDRRLVGCDHDQALVDTVHRAAEAVDVEVELRLLRIPGDVLLAEVVVPQVSDRVVTTSDGRLLRRKGSENLPLRGDALARFVLERQTAPWEDETIAGLTPDDLDRELLADLAARRGRSTSGDPHQLLKDLRVQPPGAEGLTGATLILFGRAPAERVPGARVQAVLYAGPGPDASSVSQRYVFEGPVPRLVEEVATWLGAAVGGQDVVLGTRREHLPALPYSAAREVIVNALAHRDYRRAGASVDVRVWSDRVEVQSPGGLPGHVTLANIRREHYSRNAKVMQALNALGYVEEFGEGVDRIYQEMSRRLLPDPVFDATDASVTVTLLLRGSVNAEEQAWLLLLGGLALNEAERRGLALARREGSVARRDLAARGVDDPGRVLRGLVTKGLLVRRGPRGGAHYVLSEEVVRRAGGGSTATRQRQRQQLVDEANRRGQLATREAAEVLGESMDVARALLHDLVAAGHLRVEGRTSARRFLPTGT